MTALSSMGIRRQNLCQASGPIYGFNGAPVSVAGTLTLPVTLGEFPRQVTHDVQFVAVDTESPYNAIVGRPLQTAFQAVPSIPHLAMKFVTPAGVGVVRGFQDMARSCYLHQSRPEVISGTSIYRI
ncbi:hypothetical protein KSP39_PZI022296 [Platanthera zijinensis]|uniref:Uncharacterized protein n=1 Tax=Platanthera zijinensis TaxID=2320716 RepID=A0AAP0AV57_9ASPA